MVILSSVPITFASDCSPIQDHTSCPNKMFAFFVGIAHLLPHNQMVILTRFADWTSGSLNENNNNNKNKRKVQLNTTGGSHVPPKTVRGETRQTRHKDTTPHDSTREDEMRPSERRSVTGRGLQITFFPTSQLATSDELIHSLWRRAKIQTSSTVLRPSVRCASF